MQKTSSESERACRPGLQGDERGCGGRARGGQSGLELGVRAIRARQEELDVLEQGREPGFQLVHNCTAQLALLTVWDTAVLGKFKNQKTDLKLSGNSKDVKI